MTTQSDINFSFYPHFTTNTAIMLSISHTFNVTGSTKFTVHNIYASNVFLAQKNKEYGNMLICWPLFT
jgi:hypothetical protein